MSLSLEGLNIKVKSSQILVSVKQTNPLIQLCNQIDWMYLTEIAIEDLKSTTKKGFWWLGRNLYLRIHLAVMILQIMYKLTDRSAEENINNCPLYQVFCGREIISRWKCPDHTKIEEFRNRLGPETHLKISQYIVQLAVNLGFACPKNVDIDSTIQEANMAYPSDASLMKKLALKCKKVFSFLAEEKKINFPLKLSIDIQAIVKMARSYFFVNKNACIEKKRELFSKYHSLVKREIMPFIKFIEDGISKEATIHLPWNIVVDINTIQEHGRRYLLDVAHFIRTHSMKEGKILSFQLREVACFRKGKPGKENEFGRNIQVGRIGGNYLAPYQSTSIRMEDKKELKNIITEHEKIFGEGVLETVTADKGYYSNKNLQLIKEKTGHSDGMQRPSNIKNPAEEGLQKEKLYNRRSGVEPVIGHAKRFGLGQSKMKSDGATLASAYRSVAGFNLSQIMKDLTLNSQVK